MRRATDPSPMEVHTVTDAAERTLRKMDLSVSHVAATEIDGIVTARTAQDREVTIKVDKQGDGVSHVSLRVGMLGDEQISLAVLERLERELGVADQQADEAAE